MTKKTVAELEALEKVDGLGDETLALASEPVADIVYVMMARSTPSFAGGPVTAQVHPDEVGNFEAGGWSVAIKSLDVSGNELTAT